MNADELRVEYTNDDDGLWLVCGELAENYVTNLGYFPTVGEINRAAEQHIAEKHQPS